MSWMNSSSEYLAAGMVVLLRRSPADDRSAARQLLERGKAAVERSLGRRLRPGRRARRAVRRLVRALPASRGSAAGLVPLGSGPHLGALRFHRQRDLVLVELDLEDA